MPTTIRRDDDEPTLEELEPNGYLLLHCKDTGDDIELRADQLSKVRCYQKENPPGWVQATTRDGDVTDFWWPSIRRITVMTHAGREHGIALDEAMEREANARDKGWD